MHILEYECTFIIKHVIVYVDHVYNLLTIEQTNCEKNSLRQC